MRQLEIEAGSADQKQDKRDIGVADRSQNLGPQAFSHHFARGVFEGERALAFDLATVEQGQQGIHIVGHQIDHVFPQGLGFGNRHAVPYRLFNPVGIATPLLGHAAGLGHHVVHDLLGHGFIDVFAAGTHRVSGPDIGPRRHGGDIGGHRDHDTGRCGPGAGRCHKNNDRCAGSQDFGNDLPHGFRQPAGRVELNHDAGRLFPVGSSKRIRHESGNPRSDRCGNFQNVDGGRFLGCHVTGNGQQQHEQGEQESFRAHDRIPS